MSNEKVKAIGRRKRWWWFALWGGGALFAGLGLLFVTLVGPWPTYSSGYETTAYFEESLAAMEQAVSEVPSLEAQVAASARLVAGWASESITPEVGGPLAGFGARRGEGSTGIHDEVFVKALAVGDGTNWGFVLGSDLLIVPENVADVVRARIDAIPGLNGDHILFNATHNHSGPGGFAPGSVSQIFNGPYDPREPGRLTEAMVRVIRSAWEGAQPASVVSGGVDVPEYIRNRERSDGRVDSELSVLLVEQAGGDRCVVVSYSAHPTILGSDNMEVSGEYPGFLMRHLRAELGVEAIYLGGALGSMGHRAPEGETDFERSEAMGRALAERALAVLKGLPEGRSDVAVAAAGFPLSLPPYQARLNPDWRFSKYLLPMLGIDHDAWLQGLRLGDTVLVGLPADYSGEISVALKETAAREGIDLWVLSFNGDYVGYISPDRYYSDVEPGGGLGYELGTMSWIGPDQEAYTTNLVSQLVRRLRPPAGL